MRLLPREVTGRRGGERPAPRVRCRARPFPEPVVEVAWVGRGALAAVSEAGRCAVLRDGRLLRRLADDPGRLRVQSAFHNPADGALLLLHLSAADAWGSLRCTAHDWAREAPGVPRFETAGRLEWPGFVELLENDLRGLTLSEEHGYVVWDLRTYAPLWRIGNGALEVTLSPGIVTVVAPEGRAAQVWSISGGGPPELVGETPLPPDWQFVESLGPEALMVKARDRDCELRLPRGTAPLPGTAACTQGSFLFLYEHQMLLHFGEEDVVLHATVARTPAEAAEPWMRLEGLRGAHVAVVGCLAGRTRLAALQGDRLRVCCLRSGRRLADVPLGAPAGCLDTKDEAAAAGTRTGEVVWVW